MHLRHYYYARTVISYVAFEPSDGRHHLLNAIHHRPPHHSPPRLLLLRLLHPLLLQVLHGEHPHRSPSGHLVGAPLPPKEGLDNSVIDSFPTFIYATVKDFRIEKYGLECAICLVEFEDESMLRLLTACCHVFHQECIDLWLESHKTCPFCRRNLETSSVTDKSPMILAHQNVIHEINESHNDDEIRIDIEEATRSDHRQNVTLNNIDVETERERFSRSHSTGHSIVRPRLEADRFTLRLPESVKIRLLRGHNATGSSTTFGEFSRQRGSSKGGFGEVSEHGSRSGRGEISKL